MFRTHHSMPCATPEQRRDTTHAIIAEALCVDRHRVTDTADLAQLGADSLDGIEIALDLEDALGRDLPSLEGHDLTTVDALVAAVERDFA